MARLEQRTDDLATDVRTLAPLVVAVAEVKLTMGQVQREQMDVHKAVEAIRYRLDQDAEENRSRRDRREQQEREQRAQAVSDAKMRRIMVVCSSIAAVAALMAAAIGLIAVFVGGGS